MAAEARREKASPLFRCIRGGTLIRKGLYDSSAAGQAANTNDSKRLHYDAERLGALHHMYICICEAVSDTTVSDAIAAGARTVDDVGERCGAGTVCGNCRQMIETLLETRANSSHESTAAAKEDG